MKLKKRTLLLLTSIFLINQFASSQIIHTENFNTGGGSWHPVLLQGNPEWWTVGPNMNGFNFDSTPLMYLYSINGTNSTVQNVIPINASPYYNTNSRIYMAFDFKAQNPLNGINFVATNYLTQEDTVWVSNKDTTGRDTVDISLLANNPLTIYFASYIDGNYQSSHYFAVDNIVIFASDLTTNTSNTSFSSSDKVDLFPNPTINMSQLKFNEPLMSNTDVSIINCSGQEILNYSIPQGLENFEIDLSQMAFGYYFINIKNEEFTITKKLIKQ